MPVIKSKYNYSKVFRPTGSRYANGSGNTLEEAIKAANTNFYKEFSREPDVDSIVYEIFTVTGPYWHATVLEIKD